MPLTPELWGRIKKILAQNPSLNEANTKGKLIEPILPALGWDMMGDEIERELDVRVGSSTAHVDYALKIDGIPRMLLEVKPLNTRLNDDHAHQTLSYAAIKKVKWCSLTNGRTYRIYNSEWSSDPMEALCFEFELTPDAEPDPQLDYLSREALASERLEQIAGDSRAKSLIRSLLVQNMDQIRSESRTIAKKIVFDQIRKKIPDIRRSDILDEIEYLLRIDVPENQLEEDVLEGISIPIAGIQIDGSKTIPPWIHDGKKWHLEMKCSERTKRMFLDLNDLLTKNSDAKGPIYDQKYYISYLVNNCMWLNLETKKNLLILNFRVRAKSLSPDQLAKILGIAAFKDGGSLSEKIRLGSSIGVYSRDEDTDWVVLRIKEDFNLQPDSFLRFIKVARSSFDKQ